MALQSVEMDHELYFLVAKFLEGGPCHEAARVLKNELSSNGLLQFRKDWKGRDHLQSYNEVAQSNQHIKSNFLKLLCERIGPLIDQYTSPDVKGIRSLLCNGRQSLLRSGREALTFDTTSRELACYHAQPALKPLSANKSSVFTTSIARSLHGSKSRRPFLKDCNLYGSFCLHKRILGHLASVYCVMYDRSGSIIATGADDHLVKLWSARNGRLVSTLRGHTGEIADMAISFDNTFLASGSCDKTIRVWSLQTSACIAVLLGHSGIITSLDFSPLVMSEMSYLLSTGADGTVCFWKYYSKDNSFDPLPLKFNEKSRPGAQMLCSSFSPGGSFLVTGSSDSIIRIYQLLPGPPERIAELSGHADHVDSIQFNHAGSKFVSGSRDGTAKVWFYQGAEWQFDNLSAYTVLQQSDLFDLENSKNTKLKVTMVGWSKLDDLIITAITDHSLKVWESKSGKLVHILKGHSDEVFCLESHPEDPYLFLSTGHDGNVILWNLQTGARVTMLFNMLEGQGHGALFDCRFSPDGMQLAMTDSHGHLCLYGYGPGTRFQKVPYEQFFHTDYRPLIRDANHYVLDEMTQLAPHLMPPPYLVNVDGEPHRIEYQLLIPGRNQTNLPQRRSRPSLNNLPPLLAEIEAAERGGNPGLSSPQASNQQDFPPLQSPGGGGVGLRQTGDVEGVRQLQSNSYIIQDVSNSDCASWRGRKIAPPLATEDARKSTEIRSCQGKEELRRYLLEKKRRPQAASKSGPPNTTAIKDKRSLRERRRTARRSIQPQAVPQPRTQNRPTYSTRSHTVTQETEDDIDVEVVSSDAEEAWASSSSGDESSECSDWAEEAGMREEREARKRRARRVVTSDEEEVNEEQTEETLNNAQSSPRQKPKEEKSKKQKKQKQAKRPSLKNKEEYILHYQPPEWMMMVKPKKSPYFPQVGDQIYYYRQGHQLYVQEVIISNAYHCSANKQCYERYQLQAQELCQVVGCHFSVGPPRVCSVKLALIDKNSGSKTGQTFTVKYHDMPDVLDFLVLRQHVEQAERCYWKTGDRFRCVIDDCWWSGVITEEIPFQEEFPESRFQTFVVRWDTGEVERMSPWDLEQTSPDDDAIANSLDNESLALNSSNIPLTEEDQKLQQYIPDDSDWLDEDPSEAIERISQAFSKFFELPLSSAFIYPVDPQEYPDYFAIVAYPIDLNLIHTRLKENFYRRKSALLLELRLIEQNTRLYNEPDSDIVRNSELIVKILSQLIRNPECNDVATLTNQLTNEDCEISSANTETEDAEDESKRTRKPKRHRSTVSSGADDGGNGSSSHNSSKTWTTDAIGLMNFLISREDSEPFRQAVDIEVYPEYLTYIEEPMDFSTILHRLQHNQYVTPDCVLRDIRLVISNSRLFNTNKRSRIYVMTIRLSALFESRAEEFSQQWINVNTSRQLRKSKSQETRNESTSENNISNSVRGDSMSENHDESNRRKDSLKLTLRRELATQFTNNTNNNSMTNGSSSYIVGRGNGSSENVDLQNRSDGIRRSGRSIRSTVNRPVETPDSDSDEEASSSRGKRPLKIKPLLEHTHIRRSQRKKKVANEQYGLSDEDSSGNNHGDNDVDEDMVPPLKRSKRFESDQNDVFADSNPRPSANLKPCIEGSEPLISNSNTRYSTRLRNGISCTKTFYDDDLDVEAVITSPRKRTHSGRHVDTASSSATNGKRRASTASSSTASSNSRQRNRSFSGQYSGSDESLMNEHDFDEESGASSTLNVSSRGRIRRTASRFADYTDK